MIHAIFKTLCLYHNLKNRQIIQIEYMKCGQDLKGPWVWFQIHPINCQLVCRYKVANWQLQDNTYYSHGYWHGTYKADLVDEKILEQFVQNFCKTIPSFTRLVSFFPSKKIDFWPFLFFFFCIAPTWIIAWWYKFETGTLVIAHIWTLINCKANDDRSTAFSFNPKFKYFIEMVVAIFIGPVAVVASIFYTLKIPCISLCYFLSILGIVFLVWGEYFVPNKPSWKLLRRGTVSGFKPLLSVFFAQRSPTTKF